MSYKQQSYSLGASLNFIYFDIDVNVTVIITKIFLQFKAFVEQFHAQLPVLEMIHLSKDLIGFLDHAEWRSSRLNCYNMMLSK
jgi:hypothetical protein